MRRFAESSHHEITTFQHDGKPMHVSCRIVFDGIEYVGRLWFTPEGGDANPDRASLPGRTTEEVLALAHRLTQGELRSRYRRALAERRRYRSLRRATEELLSKIRYLNQVVISVRAGLLDAEGAASELDLTERQLHECVDRLRDAAGREDDAEPITPLKGMPGVR